MNPNESSSGIERALQSIAFAIQSAIPTTGMVVQSVSQNYSLPATGTTITPFDNTIPQITEGNEFMNITITPKYPNSQLNITVNLVVSCSASGSMTTALHQDSVANAIAATSTYTNIATARMNPILRHKMTVSSTTPITFRVRCGNDGAGTTTFNGAGGGGIYGGITISNITVDEIRV